MEAFNKNLEKKQIGNDKFGIFVRVDIPVDVVILEFQGKILSKADLPNPLPTDNYYLQIDKDKYLGPSGNFDDYVNHSCNPNCGVHIVGNRAFLKTICLITSGTEITFDYATTSTDSKSDWSKDCNCNAYKCRKIISGYQYLNDEEKQNYQKMGIVPKYIVDKE